jgi:hypothetical protein
MVGSRMLSKTVAAGESDSLVLFFDTGPIITLVMSRLIGILSELKRQRGARFYITPAVHRELIERPLNVKRFEFEALQVEKLIREGVLELYSQVPQKKVNELIVLANNSFTIEGKPMDIIQSGEMESVACALEIGAAGVVMDERTLRLFIEANSEMKKLLEMRFQKTVVPNVAKMNTFSAMLRGVTIIRSVELIAVAYKMGVLSGYIPEEKNGRERLLDAVLWAAKYNGCAVTEHEIEEMKGILLSRSEY